MIIARKDRELPTNRKKKRHAAAFYARRKLDTQKIANIKSAAIANKI